MDTSTQGEKDALSCTLCLEILKEPKELPCLHGCRSCEGCLSIHITVSTTTGVDGQLGFSCPGCREFIPAPASGTTCPPSTWAAKFKTDLRLKRLTGFYTCRQELPKNNEQHVRQPCLEHANTEVGLYCVDCSKTICHLCAATSHCKCNHLTSITKAAEYLRSKRDNSENQTQSLIEEIAKRIRVRESLEKEVYKKVALVVKEISELAQKVLEYQQIQLLEELCQHYNALLENLTLNISTLIEDVRKLKAYLRLTVNYTDIDLCSDTSFNAAIDSFHRNYIATNKQYSSLCQKLSATCRFEANNSPYASLGSILFESEICNTEGPNYTALSTSMPTLCSTSMPSGTKDTQGSLSAPIDLIGARPTHESMSLSTPMDLTVAGPTEESVSLSSGLQTQNAGPTQKSVSLSSGLQTQNAGPTQKSVSLSSGLQTQNAGPTQESVSLSSGSQTQNCMHGSMSRIQTNSARRTDTSKFDRVRYRGFPETSDDGTFLPLKKRK